MANLRAFLMSVLPSIPSTSTSTSKASGYITKTADNRAMTAPPVELPLFTRGGRISPRFSNGIRIAITPAETFPLLIAERRRGSWPAAIAGPVYTAFVLGCVTSIAATGVVSAISILSGTLAWSFVPALQMASGLWLCRRPPAPHADRVRALALLFSTHLPWTLWIVLAGFRLILFPVGQGGLAFLLATTLVPAIWTRRLLISFCIHVLGCGRADARRRTRVHQLATLAVAITSVGWAIGLVPRIVGLFS
jgi:hypothetical protein